MGQQFVQFVDGVIGNAAENVMEPDERINFDELTRRDETAKHRRRAAIVAAEKRPVVSSDGEASKGTFGGVIVDRKDRHRGSSASKHSNSSARMPLPVRPRSWARSQPES